MTTPAELMETELRIAYVELHDRHEQLERISAFWCDLAQHYARTLDAMRKDPLVDLFPFTGPGRAAVPPISLSCGSAGPHAGGGQ